MRSGTRELHFATPMPGGTQRRHETPKAGDSKAAIRRTQHMAAGPDHVKCLDFNMQVILLVVAGIKRWVAIGAHWPTIGQNGYDRCVINGHVRKLTRAEKRMTIQAWVTRHGGGIEALHMLRRPNGDHILTWDEAVPYAKAHGVVLTPELKSRKFATPAVAKAFVDVCRKHDYPCWTMALLKMKEARGKCSAIVTAGGQFAIIFGNFRSMARGKSKIANWTVAPTQIWGPGSAKRWLVQLRAFLKRRKAAAK